MLQCWIVSIQTVGLCSRTDSHSNVSITKTPRSAFILRWRFSKTRFEALFDFKTEFLRNLFRILKRKKLKGKKNFSANNWKSQLLYTTSRNAFQLLARFDILMQYKCSGDVFLIRCVRNIHHSAENTVAKKLS